MSERLPTSPRPLPSKPEKVSHTGGWLWNRIVPGEALRWGRLTRPWPALDVWTRANPALVHRVLPEALGLPDSFLDDDAVWLWEVR